MAGGNGAAGAVAALEGNTSQSIDFGPVIAGAFTICSVTRYSGLHNRQRILQGLGANWLHGHVASK